MNDRRPIGIALSGGGHRATLWALGVLLYLADAEKNREVGAISSVSGGSIANGVVAHEVDYATVRADEFELRVTPLIRHVANVGLFFWGPSTNAFVISVFFLAAVAVAALVTGIVLVALNGLEVVSGIVLAAGLIVFLIGLWRFRQRSLVLDRALARTHFSNSGSATPLSDVARSLDHIFCATELQAGDHLYFSPRFVYAFQLGAGKPGNLKLSTAVQSSACLPGAFAERRLPTARHRFKDGKVKVLPDEMVLVDGGVYDNMADEWIGGLADRLAQGPDIRVMARSFDEAIVVNASAKKPWRPFPGSKLPLVGEITVLKRVNDVMYDVTTSRRRKNLFEAWEAAGKARKGMRGALVHIAQSPYHVADDYEDHPTRGARARSVIGLLGDDPKQRKLWADRAEASAKVKTVLRKLGRPTSVELLEHSYVLAMCNLHVLLDYPLLSLPGQERFNRLVAPQ
jgi:predicted acylesterase/phospholipase RssA